MGRVSDSTCLLASSGTTAPNNCTGGPSMPLPALMRCGMAISTVLPFRPVPAAQSVRASGTCAVLPSKYVTVTVV